MAHSSKTWWTAGIIGLAVAALASAWLFLPLKDWLLDFSAWATSLGWTGVVVFTLVYFLGTMLLAPGLPMTLALAFAYGWWAVLISFGAGLSAALASFLIARYGARDAAKRFLRRYPALKALDSVAADDGFKAVALFRLSPVAPFAPSNYAFGLTAVSLRAYLLGTAAGVVPGTLLNVYLGVLGRTASQGEASGLGWAALGVGLAATVLLTVWLGKTASARLKAGMPRSRAKESNAHGAA